MPSSLFRDCLADVYLGEQTGEAAFGAMLARAADDAERHVVATLLQAETEAKAMMRPLLFRLGLPMTDNADARAGAEAGAAQLGALPWRERFAALADMVTATYLARYEELAALVTPEEDAEAARIARFMGDHERALLGAARAVAAGAADPVAPVTALLRHPLPRPGG
jgi:hypothetical protein